jgi:hypothetical protein
MTADQFMLFPPETLTRIAPGGAIFGAKEAFPAEAPLALRPGQA